MEAVKEGDELFASGCMHREFQRRLDGFGATVGEVSASWRLDWNDRVELFSECRHVSVVIIGAAHVDKLRCLILDRFHYFRMTMSCRTHCDAGVSAEK